MKTPVANAGFNRRAGPFAAAPALVVLALVLAPWLPLACSSSSQCGPCAAGNQCIDDGSGHGASCHKVCSTQTGCPTGYSCHEGSASGKPVSWCIQNWHALCLPTDGEQGNPACDASAGFSCYAQSPTDANAFCTKFSCTKDTDCLGGWWCATVNQAPNASTSTPTFGMTRTVCLPRGYCSPCQSDLDCTSAPDSTPQRCVQIEQGDRYCATQCAKDNDCPLDATCSVQATVCAPSAGSSCQTDHDCPPANGTYQHCDGGHCTPECGGNGDCASGQTCVVRGLCTPNAGTCKGDGGFCSPCRSDADCTKGYCLTADHSTETFCSVKSTVSPCQQTTLDPPGCPKRVASDNWLGTSCTSMPADQCEGDVSFGVDNSGRPVLVPGCWTVHR